MNKSNHYVRILITTFGVLTFLAGALLPGGKVLAQDPLTPEVIPPAAKLIIPENGVVIPDQYIVVLKPETVKEMDAAGITASIEAMGGKIGYLYDAAFKGYSAYLPAEQLSKVLADPAVDYVEADTVISIDTSADAAAPEAVAADTTQYGVTWGLDRIDQRSLPLNGQYKYENAAASVHVYVIDTGILSTHVDFGLRVKSGYTVISDGLGTEDCIGRGTHVAGTVAGTKYGVAKKALLHPVRVLDCSGNGSVSGLIAGINWVTNHRIKPAVATMSVSVPKDIALNAAIDSLNNSGVTVVALAGDKSADACNYSPGSANYAFTVGATRADDYRAGFSNFGACVNLFAPGKDILSDGSASNTATLVKSGTAMAAAHVAGVAALYLQAHPTALPSEVRSALQSNATTSKVINAGTGSPNRLLYSLFNAALTGFDSQFNGSKAGWARISGAASWGVTAWSMYTNGTSDAWSSVYYKNNKFSDFDYSAKVKRFDGSYWKSANYLAVRMGTGTLGEGSWYPGYLFGYSNLGTYSIWEANSGGSWTPIQNFTATSAIKKGDWNILRVVASGSTMKFYINGTLVKTISDSTRSQGYVGFEIYKYPTSDGFYVDWATLTGLAADYVNNDTVSADQQALNQAVMDAGATGSPKGNHK